MTRPLKTDVNKDASVDVDELALDDSVVPLVKKPRTTASSVPAKHGAPEARVALTPGRITSHFKTSKAAAITVEKKVDAQFDIPQTPRHRDSARKVPITPRHRVLVPGKQLTPRTPVTPSTPRSNTVTIYNKGREVFAKGNVPSSLYGREKERAHLESFISSRIHSRSSGCIYVSGPPGTGKSAFVNDITSTVSTGKPVASSYINCMSVRNADDIHIKLLDDLVKDASKMTAKPSITLKKLFYSNTQSYLIALDEIDHLLDVDLELLYTLFEWALDPKSSLILIGIANALDFTDRFLPRMKSRGLKPDLLPFLPYSSAQLSAIITSKLRSLLPPTADKKCVPFLHPTAIMFLAKKVSSQSGDLRKSLDICRRAIDLIEEETKKKAIMQAAEITPSPTPSPCKTPGILVENMNLSSPVMRSPAKKTPSKRLLDPVQKTAEAATLADLTFETAPRATIAHMARITATIFSNGAMQRLQNLNLQQKAVLCSLTALETRKREMVSDPYYNTAANPFAPGTPSRKDNTSAPTIRELYETYSSLCKRENLLHPLTSSEFRDVVGSLETLSMVSAVEGRAGSFLTAAAMTPSKRGRAAFGTSVEDRKVASSVSRAELEQVVDGMKVGRNVLWSLLKGDCH